MEIERITEERDVAGILGLDDPRLEEQVLSRVECTKAEWVQWIVSYVSQPRYLGIWAVRENGKIRAYIVVVNAVNPPLSRACLILYQNFFGMSDEEGAPYHERLLEAVKEWARECGARRLCIQTDYPRVNGRLGFVEEGHSMVLELA